MLMLNKQGHGPTCHRLRPVKHRSTGVNPPELTRGSSPAKPETAETFGFASPATKGADEGVYVELGVARIHLCKRQGLRWPELTGGKLVAVAGVRARSGLALGGTGGEASVCVRFLVRCGARCRAR